MTGIVKWFDDVKGYGFITPDIPSKDIFVHFSGIRGSSEKRKSLVKDQRVTYIEGMGKKGPEAHDVAVVG